MTAFGTAVSYLALLFKNVNNLGFVWQLLARQDIQSELMGNITLQIIVSFLFLIFEFFSIRQKWTFKTIEEAKIVA